MTDTATTPLVLLGTAAASCEGDFCDVPARSERAVVNEMVDAGEV